MKVTDFLAVPAVQQALYRLLTRGFKTRFLIFTITITGRRFREILAEQGVEGVPVPDFLEP